MSKIFAVGIGYKPLEKRARDIVLNSETILASGRLHEVFKRYEEYDAVKDRVKVINNINDTIAFLKASLHGNEASVITLLASGDPMFFGIGRRAVEELGKEMVEIIPELSSVQIAFARIKEPWDDALLMSLHGGPDPNRRRKLEYSLHDLPDLLSAHNKIAILTDRINNPAIIARTLAAVWGDTTALKLYVCEKLGYPDEKITGGTASAIAAGSFSDPNVVILIKSADEVEGGSLNATGENDVVFGLTADNIIHSRGLITKDEVRAVTLHKLQLPATGVFWDIGSGSGSISLEAARFCPRLALFAVERNEEQIRNITENKRRLQLANIRTIHGSAPEALAALPHPDRVFIGGSGGRITEIIGKVGHRMKQGIIVINAATVETFTLATESLKKAGYAVEVSQVSISRMKPLGDGHLFAAQNQVFVIKGKK
jgi:precorrin-6B C5,15-methyltransferase / cobalt-precorrin-6B C5,C15-methyltransferase